MAASDSSWAAALKSAAERPSGFTTTPSVGSTRTGFPAFASPFAPASDSPFASSSTGANEDKRKAAPEPISTSKPESGSRDSDWLSTLPTTPFFALLSSNRNLRQSTSEATPKDGLDPVPLPPSPTGPGITKTGPTAASVMSSTADSSDEEDGSPPGKGKAKAKGATFGRSQTLVIVHETDAILAAPSTTGPGRSELRILQLAKYKSRQSHHHKVLQPVPPSAGKPTPGRSAGHEDIDDGLPREPFVRLLPSPNERLLAVIGRWEIGVIVLPREGWYDRPSLSTPTTSSDTLQVAAYPIGRKYHSLDPWVLTSSSPIVDVLWHPFGTASQVLLVLTYDGTVREYDLGKDTAEPAQIIRLSEDDPFRASSPTQAAQDAKKRGASSTPGKRQPTPNWKDRVGQITPTKSPSRSFGVSGAYRGTPPSTARKGKSFGLGDSSWFGADDDDEHASKQLAGSEMVAMCLGEGKGDWGALTLYGMTREGDVVAVCPYLPVSCEMPAAYIHSLSYFVSAKLELLAHQEAPSPSIKPNLLRSLDYIQALASQLPTSAPSTRRGRPRLLSRPPASSGSEDGDDPEASVDGEFEELGDELVPLTPPPKGVVGRPRRQGPFLMQPAPREFGEDEAEACDLLYFSRQSAPSPPDETLEEETTTTTLGGLIVAYKDRIDVCLEVEKPEPTWQPSSFFLPPGSAEALELRSVDPPALAVFESIDLQRNRAAEGYPEAFETSATTLVRDPIYGDAFYAFDTFGAWSLSISKWLAPLVELSSSATRDSSSEEMAKKLERLEGTEIVPLLDTTSTGASPVPARGLAVVRDPYLGYSLIITTESLKTAAIEMTLRPEGLTTPRTGQSAEMASTSGQGQGSKLYKTLLSQEGAFTPASGDSIFVLEQKIDTLKVAVPEALRGPRAGVTTDSLRATLQVTTEVGKRMRSVVEAANASQDRIKLQLDELGRQQVEVPKAQRRLEALERRGNALDKRLEKVGKQQQDLVDRADRVLQALMNRATPELSKHERQWFAELEKVKEQVGSVEEASAGDKAGFRARLDKIKSHVDDLVSDLEALEQRRHAKSQASSRSPFSLGLSVSASSSPGSPARFGKSQIRTIELKLAEETKLLQHATEKVERLTRSLEGLAV